jgi:hypothetical protein
MSSIFYQFWYQFHAGIPDKNKQISHFELIKLGLEQLHNGGRMPLNFIYILLEQ